ncbi:hypothetical protein DL96DRAFT_1119149 [Flagelloscypha sp. PMI_526]|nr:hypothetical protein DL96DRAFT_1119149 [Flagelloscypha sp. PMI_526]
MFQGLPPELWLSIASHLSRREIARLALVNRTFFELARSATWSGLVLGLPIGAHVKNSGDEKKNKEWIRDVEESYKKTIQICKAANACHFVRRLEMYSPAPPDGLPTRTSSRLSFFQNRSVLPNQEVPSYNDDFLRLTAVNALWFNIGGDQPRGPASIALTYQRHPFFPALWNVFGSTITSLTIHLSGNFEQLSSILPTPTSITEPLLCLERFKLSIGDMYGRTPNPWFLYPEARKCKSEDERRALLQVMAYLARLYQNQRVSEIDLCLQANIEGLVETLLPHPQKHVFPQLLALYFTAMPSQIGLPSWDHRLRDFIIAHRPTLLCVSLRYMGVPHLRVLMKQLQEDYDANPDIPLPPFMIQIYPSTASNKIYSFLNLIQIQKEVAPVFGSILIGIEMIQSYVKLKEPQVLEILPSLGEAYPKVKNWCVYVRWMSPMYIIEVVKAFPRLKRLETHYKMLHISGKKVSTKEFVDEFDRIVEQVPEASDIIRTCKLVSLGFWAGSTKKAEHALLVGVAKHLPLVRCFWGQGDLLS